MKNKTKKPSKQRKRLFQTPYHRVSKVLSAHLSSDLSSSYNRRTVPVRKGDTVRLLRGDHEGFEGKISKVDRKMHKIFVEGITREKADGTVIPVSLYPSKVEVISLNLDDNWRKESLKKVPSKETKISEDTLEKTEESTKAESSDKVSVEIGGL